MYLPIFLLYLDDDRGQNPGLITTQKRTIHQLRKHCHLASFEKKTSIGVY